MVLTEDMEAINRGMIKNLQSKGRPASQAIPFIFSNEKRTKASAIVGESSTKPLAK